MGGPTAPPAKALGRLAAIQGHISPSALTRGPEARLPRGVLALAMHHLLALDERLPSDGTPCCIVVADARVGDPRDPTTIVSFGTSSVAPLQGFTIPLLCLLFPKHRLPLRQFATYAAASEARRAETVIAPIVFTVQAGATTHCCVLGLRGARRPAEAGHADGAETTDPDTDGDTNPGTDSDQDSGCSPDSRVARPKRN